MKRRWVVTTVGLLACGSKHDVASAGPDAPTLNPPPAAQPIPEVPAPEEPVMRNPPEPLPELVPPPVNPPPPPLPTWDAVPSPHPPGATNPPMPLLVVTPDGACFKEWASPMAPRPPDRRGDRVEECADHCPGTPIECPAERSGPLLEAWRAKQDHP